MELDQKIPYRIDLVDQVVEKHRLGRPLAGVTALLIQHQLGHNFVLAKALIDLGLDPKNLFWIDIPYTSNAILRKTLANLKIPPQNFFVHNFRVLDFYAPYQRQRINKVVKQFLENSPDKLIVLDDGAYFLESVTCFDHRIQDVAIIEQTTRGLIKIRENSALRYASTKIPIINVAGSSPKRNFEPPFIGMSVCAALEKKLASRFKNSHGERVLILGYGSIGKQVTRFVEEHLGFSIKKIHIHDPRLKSLSGVFDRYQRWDKGDFKIRFDLVIGCSGRSSFGIGDYVYLNDGAVLVSASSGSVELSRREFIELADVSDIDDIWIDRKSLNERNIHSDIHIRFPQREVVFFNAGFPANFDGRLNCVPTHYIQPTVAMMVWASIQAINVKETGLILLDNSFCNWLDTEFRKILGKDVKILENY